MKVSKTISKYTLHYSLAVALMTSVAWAQVGSFSIQIASAPSEAEAQTIVATLKANGIEAYWVKAEVAGKGTRYRVRIGRFGSQSDAKAVAERTRSSGLIKEFIITNYEAPSGGVSPLREAKSANKPKQTDQAKVEKKPPAQREPVDRESSQSDSVADKPESSISKELPKNKESKKSGPQGADKKADSFTFSELSTPKPVEPSEKKEPQGSSIAVEPVKKSSNSAATQPETAAALSKPEAEMDPKIATPAVADALAESTINTNWKVVRRSTETDKNLRAIFFVDSMTGWAAGDAGAVYRTTDGGRSWKPLLCGAPANINFIFFVDWNNGWMLGETVGKGFGKDASEGEILLFTTNNSGRTWTNKPLPNVLSLYFIDPQNGWAVGKDATVLKTSDGGGQWSQIASMENLIGLPVESSTYNFGFRDVFFLDANRGWMLGNFYGRARSNIGGLYVTSDGGKSWKRLPLTLQTQYSSGRFTPGELHSVHFTDANTGSVTGEMYDGEGRFFFVLHTRDAGQTWEQFRTPSRAVHNTQFLDLSNGWMAVSAPREGAAEAVVYDATLMRTDNGGMSWQNDFIARGRRIHGVFFISTTKGWAVGDRGMILQYEDKSKMN